MVSNKVELFAGEPKHPGNKQVIDVKDSYGLFID